MDWSFGLTMTVLGMGGTLVTLFLLSLVIRLLNRLFPERGEGGPKEGGA